MFAAKSRTKLVERLKTILPAIVDLRILTHDREPTLFVEEANEVLWPATSAR